MYDNNEIKNFELEAKLLNNAEPKEKFDKLNLSEVTKICFYLGLVSFGGPIAHIGIFKKLLIEERKFLSENEFTDLFNICNVIPGPTSSQLLTAIMTLKSKSVFSGLISFLCFNMPALIFMVLIANFLQSTLVIQEYSNTTPETFDWKYWVYLFFLGVCQSAVANIFQAAFTLSEKIKNNSLQLILLLGSLVLFTFKGDHLSMIAIMIVSGIITVFKNDENMLLTIVKNIQEYNNNNNNNNQIKENKENRENPLFLGLPAFGVWCMLALLFIIGKLFLNSDAKNFFLADAFFRIGSIIVGGGHVVIPMIMTEFVKTNLINQTDVLNAFSIVSMMPGPMFNIAGYIGALINGSFAGFLSAFCIFLPGMLFMFFVIGKLNFLYSNVNIQYFIRGASTAGIGFIFAAAFMIYFETTLNSPQSNVITGSLNILNCFYLLKKTKIVLPLILVIGGVNYIIFRYISFYFYM